ncbi:glycosyltransferase [Thioalkalivibrio paradoxus]|uniref:Glycosyl transferase family 1 n=1 Tax=Thioalkalivibrio paradoxus ARh 1 TaxID=713585 RepID=W0DNH7_9GAMM|nr:glycosyltransferase [Thioalkalivibrio paradoxus]AHE98792.1 glycosyl transferase family 1 [Thioalkalivibrio paradoxus ARh 1]
MRVLMLSDVYFPRINGVSTSIQTFRRDLRSMGHEVDLIAPAYPGTERETEPGLRRVPSHYLFFDPEDRMMSGRFIRRSLPELAQRGYHLLHVQTPFVAHYAGLHLRRKLGLPLVETYHTHFEDYLSHYLPWLPARWLRHVARRFTRSQCNQVDAVVVPSTPVRETLEAYGVDKPAQVIPTGLDIDRFQGGDGPRFRDRLGIPADRPVLVHVGRVAHEKNIDFLLRMLGQVTREVPDVLLMIVGEGPARPHLQRLAMQLRIERNVMFLGYLDRERELLDCYSAGDAFVFASHTETQGLVLLESMASGVPLVALSALGTRDILAAHRGALVPEPNETDFADKTVRILRDHRLRAELAADARAYVQNWSADVMARRMLAFYGEVLQRHEPRAQDANAERLRNAASRDSGDGPGHEN